MAWRIDKQLIRGELENIHPGRVTGRLWFYGLTDPILLNLRGDCAPDLAGCVLTFINPKAPALGDLSEFENAQEGWVGDISASQKLRVHEVPMEEVLRLYKLKQSAPWHWANALYLEWISKSNGRVVIQNPDYILRISEPQRALTETEYQLSREASGREYLRWMHQGSPGSQDALGGDPVLGGVAGETHIVNLWDELAKREEAEPDDEEGEEWKKCDP